jgi:three-Cys-motif partner protein
MQTEKKHKILKSYLDAWYPILSWNRRLIVVDGFAGRGCYTARGTIAGNDVGNIEGSPLILLKSLINHDKFRDGALGRL